MTFVKKIIEHQGVPTTVNGSNGCDTSCRGSALTVAQLRKQLSLNGQNGVGVCSREQSLRTLLGLNGCIVEADLDSTADIKSYLHHESIDRINYFDSNDFLNGKLPDEDYISVLIGNERKNIEDVGDDYKRLHMLRKAFRFNYDRYLDVFKDKLVRVARDIYKQALYNKLLSDSTGSTAYVSEELAEEQNRPVRNFQNVNGTYKWAVDSLAEDRDAVVGIHRYLRDGDGQRKFVRDLINSQKLHHSNGDDSAMEYITGWVGRSPQSLLKARVVLDELIEDIPLGPNRLSVHLNSLEDRIKDSASHSSGWSWWNLIGIRGRHAEPAAKNGLASLNEKPLPDFMVDLEDRITALAKDVFENEKRIIEEVKVEHRRHFLKVASAWTGVGTVISAIGAGTTYWVVNRANAIYFNEKVTSIEGKIRPYRQLVYEAFLTQARRNLPAFPAERRDPLDISGHEVWTNQNFAVETQQFRMGICRDYSRPLGLCFIPELPQNVNMDGIPAFLRTNLSNCLRGLISQDIWNSNQISWIIGSSLQTMAPVPGSNMVYFLGPHSRYRNVVVQGRARLEEEPPEETRTRSVAEYVANSRGLQGQEKKDFINAHLQPRNFVDIDPHYTNIGAGLRIFSEALRRRKFDVLISGSQLSNEQYQGLVGEGIDTGNIDRYSEPQEAIGNIQRFKGYEVIRSLIRQFDEAKNNYDIAKIEQLEPLIDESIRTSSALYPPEEARIAMNHLALCETILEKLNRAFEIRYQEIKTRNTYRARLINEEPMYSVLNR